MIPSIIIWMLFALVIGLFVWTIMRGWQRGSGVSQKPLDENSRQSETDMDETSWQLINCCTILKKI